MFEVYFVYDVQGMKYIPMLDYDSQPCLMHETDNMDSRDDYDEDKVLIYFCNHHSSIGEQMLRLEDWKKGGKE